MSKYRDGIIDRLTKGKGLMGVDSIKLAALIDEIARLGDKIAGLEARMEHVITFDPDAKKSVRVYTQGGEGGGRSFIFGKGSHQVPEEPEKGEHESSNDVENVSSLENDRSDKYCTSEIFCKKCQGPTYRLIDARGKESRGCPECLEHFPRCNVSDPSFPPKCSKCSGHNKIVSLAGWLGAVPTLHYGCSTCDTEFPVVPHGHSEEETVHVEEDDPKRPPPTPEPSEGAPLRKRSDPPSTETTKEDPIGTLLEVLQTDIPEVIKESMEIPIPEEEVCESCSGLGEYWDSDTDKYKVCACREEESGQESGQDSPIIEKVKVLTKEETEAVIHKIFKELEKEVRSFPKPHIGLPYPEPWRSDAPAVVVPRDQRIEPVESTLGQELIGGLNEAIIFEKANRIIELLEDMNEKLASIKLRTGR